jgi:hypothetical protein
MTEPARWLSSAGSAPLGAPPLAQAKQHDPTQVKNDLVMVSSLLAALHGVMYRVRRANAIVVLSSARYATAHPRWSHRRMPARAMS